MIGVGNQAPVTETEMAYKVTHRYGEDEIDPPLSSLDAVLRELEQNADDEEHFTVSLTHESEWCLTVSRGGRVTWENAERDDVEPRHMIGVAKAEVLRLWRLLAAGDVVEVDKAPWLPGYE